MAETLCERLIRKSKVVRDYESRQPEKVSESPIINDLIYALADKYSAWKNEPSNSCCSNG